MNADDRSIESLEFVRGQSQLAPFLAGSTATGHRLKGYEARDAYGMDVLQEALQLGSAVLTAGAGAASGALRVQREVLGVAVGDVARLLNLPVAEIEGDQPGVRFQDFERLALKLGLDERLISFDPDAGADRELGVRLKTLQSDPAQHLSSSTVLAFAEAASLVRIQNRMSRWLDLPVIWNRFGASDDYGSPNHPAFQIGYDLAQRAREELGLGPEPIPSMRELVEVTLGVPVLQRALPTPIAGATISNGADRGIVLNTMGSNASVWVRRATLAHELGHLLFDPAQRMRSVRVDLYDGNDLDPETNAFSDYVEQRANAFAITFLAPPEAVRNLVGKPITDEDIASVMQVFGISLTAARYHVRNSFWRQMDLPARLSRVEPEQNWLAAEDYALDYFRPQEVPHDRRGRFAGLVAECFRRGLISSETAALYLDCSIEAFERYVGTIAELHPIS